MADSPQDDLIAGLVEDVALLKAELISERWSRVASNFDQVINNFASLNGRITALESRVGSLQGSGVVRQQDDAVEQPSPKRSPSRKRAKRGSK